MLLRKPFFFFSISFSPFFFELCVMAMSPFLPSGS